MWSNYNKSYKLQDMEKYYLKAVEAESDTHVIQ